MFPVGNAVDSDYIVNVQLTNAWKEGIARLVKRRPLAGVMALGVRLVIPRQRVGVALVTFNADEEVLLLRHTFHTVYSWGLPGGWLGRNEPPADGLRRELREETGLVASVGPPVHVAHGNMPGHIVMAYLGWVNSGPIRLNSEIIEARWFGVSQLPRPLWPFTEEAIATGLALSRMLAHPANTPMTAVEAH